MANATPEERIAGLKGSYRALTKRILSAWSLSPLFSVMFEAWQWQPWNRRVSARRTPTRKAPVCREELLKHTVRSHPRQTGPFVRSICDLRRQGSQPGPE